MRIGKTKQPSYRVVVKEARTPRSGKYIEQVGFYDPLAEPTDVRLIEDRIQYWLSVGAQPTERVRSLISKNTSLELK
jgi:small subunit ribosomal protein S16